MATIAEQLTSLANTKTAIKDAIVAKGVVVADTDPFSAYPDKIGQIQAGGGGAPATKFGASVDTWIGDVDENGVLQSSTWTGALNFAEIKTATPGSLDHKFYGCTGITSVDLSSLQQVGSAIMSHTFYGCTGITSVDLSSLQQVGSEGLQYAFAMQYASNRLVSVNLSSLQSIDIYGMQYAFYNQTGITHIDLSALQSIKARALYYAFGYCSGITSVDLDSLETVEQYGFYCVFRDCTRLETISFPSLTNVQTDSFGSRSTQFAFQGCTALTEIHFRADMQATIEAMTGYSNKFGATNATIYFDL